MLKKAIETWRKLARTLSAANTVLMLTIFYFAVVTPIGLVFRIFGKSILSARRAETAWTEHRDASSIERPF